jgi:predicted enzyme related to lactoylglutathione lyase
MGAPPNWLAYIAVPNADETIAQATRLGGTVLVPAQSVPNVGRFAVLQDPQGAAFAVIKGETSMPVPEETDPKPLEFSWHELMTTDAKAAVAFYTALFGWAKKSEFDMGAMGIYYIFGRDRFQYGGIMNKPAEVAAPPNWLHYVQVDNADEAAKRAEKVGGKIINGPMDVPGGDRIAAIVDPQGAAFAVHAKAPKMATADR